MIGRNELCPCGSGKKYKKCCLQKNQSIEFTRNKILYAKGLYENMENKIYEYAKSSSFYGDRQKAIQQFHISQDSNLKIDKLYNTYFINDYKTINGNTIIERFADNNKLTLNKSQRNVLLSMIKSNIGIFKIEDINATKTILRDYFTDNKITVEDVNLVKNLNKDDSIISRIVNVKGMNIFVQDYVKVTKENMKIILENIKQLYNNYNKKVKNKKEFLYYNSEIIYNFAQQIILNDESYLISPVTLEKTKLKKESKEELGVNIYDILKNNIEDKYLQKGLDLWNKFKKSNTSIKGSENGWAAAVEYYIKKDAGETITQAQVSQKYEVSSRTLGKRYKALKVS